MASASARTDLSRVRSRVRNTGTEDPASGPLIAVVMARLIVAAVFCGLCLLALLYVIDRGHGPGLVALASACLLALLGLQLLFSRRSTVLRSRSSHLMLAAQACLV